MFDRSWKSLCMGGSGEKNPKQEYDKKIFSNFQICHNQFFYLKTQRTGAWKLQCAQFLRNQFQIFLHSLFTGT